MCDRFKDIKRNLRGKNCFRFLFQLKKDVYFKRNKNKACINKACIICIEYKNYSNLWNISLYSLTEWGVSLYRAAWSCTLRYEAISGKWKPFKNDEKWFLFHLKSSFCSQDIYIFILIFWLRRKTAWLER